MTGRGSRRRGRDGEEGRDAGEDRSPPEDGDLEDLLGSAGRSSEGEGGKSDGGDPPPGIKLPYNYVALVGLIFVAVALFAVFNLLRNEESGTVGIGDAGIGEKIAPFAVPVATSDLEGDANIDPDRACSVEGDDVLRICDYFGRPLVISFWFTGRAAECIDYQDVFERVAEQLDDRAGFVSINVRDDRDRVEELIAERDWQVPVGHDRDGAVSNIYRVGGCPTFLFVSPDGVLEKAEIGRTSVAELGAQVRSFINGAQG